MFSGGHIYYTTFKLTYGHITGAMRLLYLQMYNGYMTDDVTLLCVYIFTDGQITDVTSPISLQMDILLMLQRSYRYRWTFY